MTCGRVMSSAGGDHCECCAAKRAMRDAAQPRTAIPGTSATTLPSADGRESVLSWNVAGWYCGDPSDSRVKPDVRWRAQRRRDVLQPVLESSQPPTYLALTEINGSTTDFHVTRGMRAWLAQLGYASELLPGPVSASKNAVRGRLGGSVLAWRVDDVVLASAWPTADPTATVFSAMFRNKHQPSTVVAARIGVVYGSHRHNGKLHCVQSVAAHVARDKHVVMAGDYNVTPSTAFQSGAGRRRVAADEQFAVLTGDGEDAAPHSLAVIVPLGHDHSSGEHTRVRRRPRSLETSAAGGVRSASGRVYDGTATIDHVVVSGGERLAWRLRSRWLVEDSTGLVSDHEIVWVERQPRHVQSDGGGLYRLPRHVIERWTSRQRSTYAQSIEASMAAFCDFDFDEATTVDELVCIAQRGADAAMASVKSRGVSAAVRSHHAGGDAKGLASQVARVNGVLRTVRQAARQHDAARARYDAMPSGVSHTVIALRLSAKSELAVAVAAERCLYQSNSPTYLARHDACLKSAARLARKDLIAARVATESRLQREVAYYSRLLLVAQRREDAPVIRGVQEAREANDPSRARDGLA